MASSKNDKEIDQVKRQHQKLKVVQAKALLNLLKGFEDINQKHWKPIFFVSISSAMVQITIFFLVLFFLER